MQWQVPEKWRGNFVFWKSAVWLPANVLCQWLLPCITDATQASVLHVPHTHAQNCEWQTFAGVPHVTFVENCNF